MKKSILLMLLTMSSVLPVSLTSAVTVFKFGPPMVVLDCEIDAIDFNKNISCLNTFTSNLVSATETTIRAESKAAIDSLNGEVTRLNTQINQMAQSLGTPLMQAIANNPINDLNNCLQSKEINIQAFVANAAANPVSYTRQQIERMWERGMTSAARLGNPATYGMTNGRPMTPGDMLNQAEQTMGVVFNQDPIGQCLWQTTASIRGDIKREIEALYPTLKAQYENMSRRVIQPAINRATVELIRPILRKIVEAPRDVLWMVLPEYNVEEVNIGVAQKYLMNHDKMVELNKAVLQLAAKIQQKDLKGASLQQQTVRALLMQLSTLDDQTASTIAIETLRAHGHVVIDTYIAQRVAPIADKFAEGIKEAIGGVITGAFGIAWEPYQVASEFSVDLAKMTMYAAQISIQTTIMTDLHQGYDRFIDVMFLKLRDLCLELECKRRAGQIFGDLLRDVPTEQQLVAYIIPHINQMQDDLFAYHKAVLKLSEAAVGSMTITTIAPTQTQPYTKPTLTSPYTTQPLRR